jgi:drug/metabolite transporter (DMT)-like permease
MKSIELSKPVLDRAYWSGILWVFLGAVLFSGKAILVKLAYRYEVDSTSLLALRMLFSLPIFWLIGATSFKKTQAKKVSLNDWMMIILIGMTGYYLASLFDFMGLKYVPAVIERLILYIYPTLVLFISAIFFKIAITKIQFIALIISYLGISIAFFDPIAIAGVEHLWLGSFLVFLAAFTYAIYIVGSSRLIPKVGTRRYTIVAMTAASGMVLLHHAIEYQLALFHFEWPVYGYALAMAIFATVMPAFMVSEGIRLIGANNTAIVGSIGPISTIALAYFFLGELFGWWQLIGTMLVIIGILPLSLYKQK